MAKRKAMGRDPLGWISAVEEAGDHGGAAGAVVTVERQPAAAVAVEFPEGMEERGPKFLTYEVLTARLRGDQIDFLNALERQIMRSRGHKGERITKNSLLRAAVDLLEAVGFDLRDIEDEDELRGRVLAVAADMKRSTIDS